MQDKGILPFTLSQIVGIFGQILGIFGNNGKKNLLHFWIPEVL